MKILVDMNLSPSWQSCRRPMHRLVAPDSEILACAEAEAFVIFTHDLDFGMLLAARKTSGPSVLQVRTQDVLPQAIGDAVVRAFETARPHLEAGALVTLDRLRSRIRVLPL